MGTKSLTHVYDDDEKHILLTMYRQMDGYPAGHGAKLVEFLRGQRLVNGLGYDEKNVFNGMGCLAAAMLAHFKKAPGSVYVQRVGGSEQYVYSIKGAPPQQIGCSGVLSLTYRERGGPKIALDITGAVAAEVTS